MTTLGDSSSSGAPGGASGSSSSTSAVAGAGGDVFGAGGESKGARIRPMGRAESWDHYKGVIDLFLMSADIPNSKI